MPAKSAISTPLPRNVDRLDLALGRYSDGEGLFLNVRPAARRGACAAEVGKTREWLFRYTAPSGKRRDMTLGALPAMGLSAARDAAREATRMLASGTDPLEARSAHRESLRQAEQSQRTQAKVDALTLARFARRVHERIEAEFKNPKHRQQWINSLEQHVPAALWQKSIARIEPAELLEALETLRLKLPETGRRVRQRLDRVFARAVIERHVKHNPLSDIRSELRAKRPRGAFRALPWREVPAALGVIRSELGAAAAALEFAVLTAARTGEVLGATFAEFDLDASSPTWLVPSARMKRGEPHLVYLSPRAAEIVRTQAQAANGRAVVFESPNTAGRPLSNMALLMVLRRRKLDSQTTVHGLCRATFSTWANETAAARPDVIEACLAHNEADRTRAAYNRAEFIEERRLLMLRWADFAVTRSAT